MQKIKYLIPAIVGIFGLASFVIAQTSNPVVCQRISLSGTSTPTQLLPSVPMTAFLINEEAGGSVNVLVFPYSGNTVPTAVPSACASPTSSLQQGKGCVEITPTKPFNDAKVCESLNCDLAGQAWAGVVESAGTVTIDSCFRGTAP